MRVLVVLRSSPDLGAAAASRDTDVLGTLPVRELPSFQIDPQFAPVEIPSPAARSFDTAPETSLYVVRGEIPTDDAAAYSTLSGRPEVAGVYSDPRIEPALICPGSPAQGTAADVGTLLGVSQLTSHGLTGADVTVAIVDTGINLAHLASKGHNQQLDAANHYTPAGVATAAGQHPVDHGTMCAFDTGIAAPNARFVDHAVLLTTAGGPTVMSGFLSDAVSSYSVLLQTMLSPSPQPRKLVVSNSWGMFDPAWDFPVGHPGNFSDNILHPFNVIVGSLEAAGADIYFAAGNCGRDCPDGRCNFGATLPICGANSHPAVMSIAGVDTTKLRVGYSSQGPGRLSLQKPDVSAYTHFLGSEAFGPGSADGGTSAACPVAAGVAAAVRTKHGPSTLSPAQLRALIQKTAHDVGGLGFDHDHGWGIVDASALVAQLPSGGGGPCPAPPWPGRFLKHPPMTQGPDVLMWQGRMAERGFALTVDGKYGPKSKAVCKEFQQQVKVQVDGIVGPVTWEASWSK